MQRGCGKDDKLYKAVLKNNLSLIGEILSKGIVLDQWAYTLDDVSPLELAARNNNIQILQLFLGVLKDKQNLKSDFNNATYESASAGHKESFDLLFQYLLAENAINSFDINYLLTYASLGGNIEIMESVLKEASKFKGWNINFADQDPTALMISSRKGNLEMVKLLIEHGADPDFVDYQNDYCYDSAVRLAVMEEKWDVVEYLIPLTKNASAKRYAKRNLDKALRIAPPTQKKTQNHKKVEKFPSEVDIEQFITAQSGAKIIDFEIGKGEEIKRGDIAQFKINIGLLGFDYGNSTKLKSIGNKVSKWKIMRHPSYGVIIGVGFTGVPFEEGVLGLRIGGLRRLLLLPELATTPWKDTPWERYMSKEGNEPESIAYGAYLVFDVKLLSIRKDDN
jgi:ankyrin repeat protein